MFDTEENFPCREVDAELFFIDTDDDPATAKMVKELCMSCPARLACFEYAVNNARFGIWGGTTERERNSYRRKHGIPRPRISDWDDIAIEPTADALTRRARLKARRQAEVEAAGALQDGVGAA